MAETTVIVPLYKSEPYLRRCVDSILAQRYRDFELVLVDDGSPDRCAEICDRYVAEARGIPVHAIHKPNGGLSSARNAGIDWAFAHSDSRYFVFIDADDWVHPDYLGTLREGIAQGVRIASVSFIRVSGLEDVPAVAEDSGRWSVMPTEEFWPTKETISATAWGKMYDRELFRAVRFPLGKNHEDQLTAYKVFFQVPMVAFRNVRYYYYYQRTDSLVNGKWDVSRMDRIQAWLEEIPFFESRGFKALADRSRDLLVWDCVEALRNLDKVGRGEFKPSARKTLRDALRSLRASVFCYQGAFELAYPLVPRWAWWGVSKMGAVRKRGLFGAVVHWMRKRLGGGD